MKSFFIYSFAALAEIGGCFAFWAVLRMGQSLLWLIPGCSSVVLFAYLLTFIDTPSAGRTYAVYGGIYITFALLWLWGVEKIKPDLWDLLGVFLCLCGAAIIFLAPHKY
ncbi:YnfA family protein [Swingsia samuiensis]|uniref:YnfA family protein n=1 Tax=Swingsia samuiensis TaxID=1293412 RepID=A0A4Y6UNB8_9PROT|nr:YnfA family protein [Swingsia samuiensis]QDH17857.1 YnfA family protein [Swingsia samuiensis]